MDTARKAETVETSNTEGRPWGLGLVLAVVLAATVAHLVVNGYAFGGCSSKIDLAADSPSGDHANILPWVYFYQDRSLFAHDLQIQSGAGYATVLWRGMAVLARIVPIEWAFFLVYLFALAATHGLLFALARRLGGADWCGVIACVLFVVAKHAPAGEATHDPVLYTRVAALPLALAAVHAALGRMPLRCLLTLAATVAVHSLTAFYVAPVVILLGMSQSGSPIVRRGAWAAGMLIAAAVVAWLVGGGAAITLGRPSETWLQLQQSNNAMHLFPSQWGKEAWYDAGCAGLFLLMVLIRPTTPDARRLAIVVGISTAIMILIGWLFAERWPSMLLMQLQPFRAVKIGMILAMVLGATCLGRPSEFGHQALAANVVLPWVGGYTVLFCVMTIVRALVPLSVTDRPAKEGPRFRSAVMSLFAVAIGIQCVANAMRPAPLAPANGSKWSYRPPTDYPWRGDNQNKWLDVQRWVAANTPTDAHVIAPPILEGFRTHAKRSCFGDWKQGTLSMFNEPFGVAWQQRMVEIAVRSRQQQAAKRLYEGYNTLTAADFHALAAEHGLTHSVTLAPVPGLREVYNNGAFRVYEVR